MKRAETIIIGGGVVGASVAYHLTQRGARDVVILESEPFQGLGSTGKATGGIRAQFETEINIKMSIYSLNFFKNCEFDCEYEPKGYLFFATTDEQLEYLKSNVVRQHSLGISDVEIVDSNTVRDICPILNCSDILGGSFGRSDGFINPLAVMEGFTDFALANGAKIVFNSEAISLIVENEKIAGVRTAGETYLCENIVICTGARARLLAETAGLDLPVEPQKRQIVWAESEIDLPEDLPMVIDIGSGFHFRPAREFSQDRSERRLSSSGNREVLFAYPDPMEKSGFDTAFDELFIQKVYDRAKHRSTFLFETKVVREKCRAGLYENTPDHHAILGGCAIGGLYFANGFSGHGVMHSPATGRALAEIILDGKSSFLDVSMLGLDRFAHGKMLHETAFI